MQPDYISELRTFLIGTYGIAFCDIVPAKRGFFGETWKVTCADNAYFVKIDYWDYHKESYRRSLSVVEFMIGNGISFVTPVIKTKTGALACDFNDGVLAMFPFIEGENIEDYPLGQLFERLVMVYKLDTKLLDIEVEDFGDQVIEAFHQLISKLPLHNVYADRIREILRKKNDIIDRYADRLRLFSARCKEDTSGFCLTHGDAGGNCIIGNGHFTVVDWDQPKLGPIERDTWFFMHIEQQVIDIQSAFRNAGLTYTLNFDRFCYYCYFSFFYYLTEYLRSFLCVKHEPEQQRLAGGIEDYFSSWMFSQLAVADRL